MGVGIAAGPHCHPGLVRLDVPGGLVCQRLPASGADRLVLEASTALSCRLWRPPVGRVGVAGFGTHTVALLAARGSPVPLRLAANGRLHQPCFTPDAGSRFGPALIPAKVALRRDFGPAASPAGVVVSRPEGMRP